MTIEPTTRQRELELQVTSRILKNDEMNKNKKTAGSSNYKRKTIDKPKPDGRLIRKLMNQAKMKPKDLWSKANITSDQLQKTLKGVGTDIEKLEAIAEVLEVEVKYLIKGGE